MVFTWLLTKHRAFLIGLLFAFFLATAAFFLWGRTKKTPALVVYTAVFEVDASVASSLSLGDTLIDAAGKEAAGKIVKIKVEDALCEDFFGVYSLPARKTLCLTLMGEGVWEGENARIGTLVPRVGEHIYLGERVKLDGICVRVRAI